MKRISFVTLGCKVNQYDTAAILNHLPSSKYLKNSKFTDLADVYVIDTCTVTHKADSEARNYIYKANRANPNGLIVVTGCYAQVSPQSLEELSEVDYVIGNSNKFSSLIDVIKNGVKQKRPKIYISDIFKEKKRDFNTPDIQFFPDRTRAFLKVQDGCNYACSFCIIPRARGMSRSLDIDEILKRLKQLQENGYKEVVLTGIHLASYGKDIGSNLINLLEQIDKSKIMNRVRLSSLDPADMNKQLIEFCSNAESICPSFHVALQSGDIDILKKMRRRYKPSDFIKCTDMIRKYMPDASIGTDVMVGFPSETDDQFKNTYELTLHSELTYFHVFPYSKRKLTTAATMPEQIDSMIKKERSKKLRELGVKKKEEFYSKFIGKTLNAIVENKNRATTYNYINAEIEKFDITSGEEVNLLIKDVVNERAIGHVV